MTNRINIDDLKAEYIGKQINWLTIINIYRNDKNIIMFTCKCKCGKEVNITKKRLFANPPISCGCFKSSPEGRALKKQYYIDHPEAKQNLSDARKKYNSEHPDEVKEIHLRIKQLYEHDPSRRDAVSKRISNWFKDNPEKVRELSEKHSQWFKDNPEKVKLGVEKQKESYNKTIEQTKDKIKQWFKDNPDFYKDWMTNNPDKVINMRNAYKKTMKEKRLQKDSSTLMQVIHPSQVELLINGDLTAQSIIKTKCLICNNYAEHIMHNIYNLTTNEFLYNRPPLCNNCRNNLSSSHIETDIYNYIATFYNGECIKNSRNIISPYELDLYYPEKKIAIEFNGLYWHSEQAGKSKEYHFNKFKLCREKGIRLISIFEQDWLYKNQKIKNILSNIFNRKIKIYARNCLIKLLDFRTKSDFINTYHFDGDSIQGNISYGLYYNNELVSVMSFGKLRGQNSLRHNNDYYELVRFVTKNEICVIGGCSKLLSTFIHDYNPKYILCYSDNDFFTGEVYNKLGFKLKSLGEKSIDYQWCNNKECLSRNQCMPSKLLDQYPKYKNMNISGSKERYIMEDLGYYRIYRCGNSIWEWLKS